MLSFSAANSSARSAGELNPGENKKEIKEIPIFITVAIMSHRQVPFYGLIQQQHLRAGFLASQGHSWWNYWDSPPFITAWHVSCSRFWCRKVTAQDSSLFVEQPSKTTPCVYRTERKCSHASNCSPTCTQSHKWKWSSVNIFVPACLWNLLHFTSWLFILIEIPRRVAK